MATYPDFPEGTYPGWRWVAVTPDDGVDLADGGARAVWVGTAGHIAIMGLDNASATFKNVASGTLLPLACLRILATGTTATDIVAVY